MKGLMRWLPWCRWVLVGVVIGVALYYGYGYLARAALRMTPACTVMLADAAILLSGPAMFYLMRRLVSARQERFKETHTAAWNNTLQNIDVGEAGGLPKWVTDTLGDQNATRENALTAQAVAWSLDIGTRQVDLYRDLLERFGDLRRETTALMYSVTLAAGALLLFSLAQVADGGNVSSWLIWGLVHLAVATGFSFAARWFGYSVAAGSMLDMARIVAGPNWKERAWAIYALLRSGEEYQQSLGQLVYLLFWWSILFLVSGAVLIGIHYLTT